MWTRPEDAPQIYMLHIHFKWRHSLAPENDKEIRRFYEGGRLNMTAHQNCPHTNLWNLRICSVQSLSRVRLFATPWTTARQASLSITNSRSSPKPMSIQSVMPSTHLILCRPLLLLPSIFPRIRVFSNESTLRYQVAKVLEFQLQHQSFQWTLRTDFL